jgi:hypothetical protein
MTLRIEAVIALLFAGPVLADPPLVDPAESTQRQLARVRVYDNQCLTYAKGTIDMREKTCSHPSVDGVFGCEPELAKKLRVFKLHCVSSEGYALWGQIFYPNQTRSDLSPFDEGWTKLDAVPAD